MILVIFMEGGGRLIFVILICRYFFSSLVCLMDFIGKLVNFVIIEVGFKNDLIGFEYEVLVFF